MTLKPNDLWYTPPAVWEAVMAFMGPDYFDPCPSNPTFDGLEIGWKRDCYINPPYSEKLKRQFIDKAIEQYCGGRFLWMLNYANSVDIGDIHKKASAVLLPFKRFKFIPGHPSLKVSSPRYNNIMILWGDNTGFEKSFGHLGFVYHKPGVDK